MAKVTEDVNDDKKSHNLSKDSSIYAKIAGFNSSRPGLGYGENEQVATSIFSIPYLMKKSCMIDKYCEDTVVKVVEVAIEEIKRCMQAVTTEHDYKASVYAVIKEQYEKYLEEVILEAENPVDIYNDSLFGKTIRNLYTRHRN